ncbi:hypothetical protein [Pseudonocardia sp. KRD291]|uniref:hypothetical protein n=1 Tax=Pseudonocardia sp. KRD291 TaxID=2792007 RepID=UPI001C49FC87|nr:hypothetical protein [Pseudonocardia sp. KRD291]MBW0102421.1 hypothetical protein [Pseudonocardia sp. KRD291]
MVDDGLRIMVDRYTDIVKSGGENASSMRVESVLHAHPRAARGRDSCRGVPPGAVADENDEPGFCRDRLAGFERPRRIVYADGMPETVGGKVPKYKLRAQLADLYVG